MQKVHIMQDLYLNITASNGYQPVSAQTSLWQSTLREWYL